MKATTHQVAKNLQALIANAQTFHNAIAETMAANAKKGEPNVLYLGNKNSGWAQANLELSSRFLPIKKDKLLQIYQDEQAAHIATMHADFERLTDATAGEIATKYHMAIAAPDA